MIVKNLHSVHFTIHLTIDASHLRNDSAAAHIIHNKTFSHSFVNILTVDERLKFGNT